MSRLSVVSDNAALRRCDQKAVLVPERGYHD